MSDVSQWSTSAGSNTSAPPDGAGEGIAPSTINDIIREMMAALARWYSDSDGTLTTGGTGNAYTLTTNSTHAALADMPLAVFRADRANTGAATLNVDGLGAKSLRVNGAALASGALAADTVLAVAYNATDDAYDIVGGFVVGNETWGGSDLSVANGGTGASTASAARTNLGLGTAAVEADTKYAHRSNNLSDLGSAGSARTNLGLGSAATETDTKYAHRSNNLSDLGSASTARTNLGLGDAATRDITAQSGGSPSGGANGDIYLIY